MRISSTYFSRNSLLLRWLGWFFAANSCLFLLIASRYLWLILSSDTLFLTTSAEVFTPNNNVTTGVFFNLFGKILVLLFTAATFIGHFALLAFIPCLILLPIILLWPKKSSPLTPLPQSGKKGMSISKATALQKNVIFFLAIIFASISVFWLLADSIVFSQYHFHLNFTWLKMLSSEAALEVLELSWKEWSLIVSIFLAIITIEIFLALAIWHYIILPQRFFYGKTLAIIFISCLLFSYATYILTANARIYAFVQQTPNLPFYNDILASILPIKNSQQQIRRLSETGFSAPVLAKGKLNYPLQLLQCRQQLKHYNILMIGIDTWRADMLNPTVTPNMYRFAQQAWQFNKHFSSGNSTQPGIFSLFYSLPSSYWTAVLQQQQAPLLIHELTKQNYQTRVFWSANLEFPDLAHTVYQEVEKLRTKSAPGLTIGDRDRFITKELIQFLKLYSGDSSTSIINSSTAHPSLLPFVPGGENADPFFAFIFYDAPHGYCWEQDFPQPFQPAIKQCNRLVLNNTTDPIPYINRYKNAVHFVDVEIGKILKVLQQQKLLDNTIVIITSDHGHEFNDNHLNYWGHASNFTPVQTQVPLIVHWPGLKPKQINYKTSHYDIVPTLMQNVLGCTNAISDYSVGFNLFDATFRPYLIIGSYIHSGILESDRITNLLTTGEITITDLHGKDLPNAKPRPNILRAVLHDMRRFFK